MPEVTASRFGGVLEAAPDAIIGIEPDGTIALVNAQVERLFGYQRDELIGQPVELLVPDRVRAGHTAHRRRYLDQPTARPMGSRLELSARRKDGTEFPTEISLSPVETDDGLLITAAIRDVSERLAMQAERERLRGVADRARLEQRLEQAQRLESLGQLAGGIAHDFNNLLAVIINYSAFVAEQVRHEAERTGDEGWVITCGDIEEIERAAKRAAELTRQLLAFARREVVNPEVLELNNVVRDVESLLHRTIGEDITLVTSTEPNLWCVLADPGQLEQVLVNLAVNARNAMPMGGTLSIDTANVDADESYVNDRPDVSPGRYVRLRVSDNGAGMDRATLNRAFEPFFTTKPDGTGTGLGLASVYGIVHQSGGHVQLYSEPGMGTTFSALWPATDQAPTRTSVATEARTTTGGETVLVVEDEDAIREVTQRILTRSGYQVVTAANGEEAIQRFGTHDGPIHLLLSDVVMPGMAGKELAQRLVEHDPKLRVLLMSGYAPVLASRSTAALGVAFIEKPFSQPTLLAKVREVLEA